MHTFPHIQDATDFPSVDTVRPYEQYRNVFDYARWTPNSLLKVMSVPWDDATVAGGNVVKFEDDAARDAWFDAQDGHVERLATEMRILPGQSINLPMPFDVCQRYNYLMVEFGPATAENDLLPYETLDGVRRYYYFIRATSYVSPNATACLLDLDFWTTYINRVEISHMVLERGHAPLVKAANVGNFLASPLARSRWLLADEPVDVRVPSVVTSQIVDVMNDEVWAVIFTTADLGGGWGSKADGDWSTPGDQAMQAGAPSVHAYAVEPAFLGRLLAWCETNRPQFTPTIQGIAFIGRRLVALGGAIYTWGGTDLNECVGASNVSFELPLLTKADFGYDRPYDKLTKLYTTPYAILELTTPDGVTDRLEVQGLTPGTSYNVTASLMFPFLSVNGHLNGFNGLNDMTVDYRLGRALMRKFAGDWAEHTAKWDIPVFSVTQSANTRNDYEHFYDRKQANDALETAYTTSVNNASVALLNANLGNATTRENALGQAATAKTNAQNAYENAYLAAENGTRTASTITNLNVALANRMNANASTVALKGVRWSNNKLESDKNADVALAGASLNADMANAAIAAANNDAKANLSASTVYIQGISDAMNMQIGSATVGTYLNTRQISNDWACTNNTINVTLWSSRYMFQASERQASLKAQNATGANNLMTNLGNEASAYETEQNNANLVAVNDATNELAVVNAGNQKSVDATNTTNAYNRAVEVSERSFTTSETIASRNNEAALSNALRSKHVAQHAIENGIAQASLAAPSQFGAKSAQDEGYAKPMMLAWSVKTMRPDEVARVGDAFFRFGYTISQEWQFENFNVMPRFSYWEVADVWVTGGEGVIEVAQDAIKTMLYNGITVWNTPDDIGRVSIYDNI